MPTVKKIEYKGKQYNSISALARERGIKPNILMQRLNRGWGMERAVETPYTKGGRKPIQKYYYGGELHTIGQLVTMHKEITGERIAVSAMRYRIELSGDVAAAVETPKGQSFREKQEKAPEVKAIGAHAPKPFKPDVTKCRTCQYHGRFASGGGGIHCDYIGVTDHKRPCPPGPNCTAYVKGPSLVRQAAIKHGRAKGRNEVNNERNDSRQCNSHIAENAGTRTI